MRGKLSKVGLFFDSQENEERGNWTGKLDFVLTSIGYAVGFGNLWRFPFLCYRNGGGAFLVPYFFCLFFIGIPLYLVEISIGQFTSQGPLTMWTFAPLFRGIGVGMVIISLTVTIYYNVILAWGFFYLFKSFASVLPWQHCGKWSSQYCEDFLKLIGYEECRDTKTLQPYPNGTCYNTTSGTLYGIYDQALAKSYGIVRRTPSSDYLHRVGFRIDESSGIEHLGPLRWDMSLLLLFVWFLVFLTLFKGIRISGKVVYVTAVLPYFVLLVLLINVLTIDGHGDGIYFYMAPNVAKMRQFSVWKDAALQIFYSLGLSWGTLATMASYNRFHTNAVRDSFIISITNCATSVFIGFVIFGYVGTFAKARGQTVEEVVESGVGLAFIVYPQAVTTIPGSVVWSILFFLMFILVGFDSQFTMVETVITALLDVFITLRRHRIIVMAVACALAFGLGLVMCTCGGPYVLTMMDNYASGWNLLVLVILECIALYFYGHLRLTRDIETMVGPTVCGCIPWKVFRWYFISCWMVISPVSIVVLLVFTLMSSGPLKYGSYTYPTYVNDIGKFLTSISMIGVLITIICDIIRTPGSCKERMTTLTRPTRTWGPALVKNREKVTYVEGFVVNPYEKNGSKGTSQPHETA